MYIVLKKLPVTKISHAKPSSILQEYFAMLIFSQFVFSGVFFRFFFFLVLPYHELMFLFGCIILICICIYNVHIIEIFSVMHFRFICGVLLFRGLQECVCVSVRTLLLLLYCISHFKYNCRIHIMRHLIRHLIFWNSLKRAYDALKCRLHRLSFGTEPLPYVLQYAHCLLMNVLQRRFFKYG